MSGTVFDIGVTSCGRTMATLVEHHPRNVIGTFWLPSTEGDYRSLGCKWIDYVLDDNSAQSMLDDIDVLKAERCLYTHMVIVLTGNLSNPGEYSFLAGITRFLESMQLLRALAKYNIPAHTEVCYPRSFDSKSETVLTYQMWNELSLDDWDEYIRLHLVANHGQSMLMQWWERTAPIDL